MSAALGDFGGTFAGAVTAGDGAGLGLEATEELSQPAAARANIATKNRFALLVMTIPLGILATNSMLSPRASERAHAAERNRRDTSHFGTSRLRSGFWHDRPCHRARGCRSEER